MYDVVVLLSTYNGEQYLNQQLDSVFSQSKKVRVFARDDGSTDSTCEILAKWAKKYPLTWYEGENLGAGRSFMELIYNAPQCEYYAFCDQDDVWDYDKLEIAVCILNNMPKDKPALYFSGYRTVDKNLNLLFNNIKVKNVSFGNSLIQNIALGCTIVFNYSAKELSKKIRTTDDCIHDAWMYRLSYATGNVYFDVRPHLSYRQHNNNLIGGKRGIWGTWLRRKKRISKIWKGRISTRTKVFESYCKSYITDKNKSYILSLITHYKDSIKNRITLIRSKEFTMQSRFDTLIFKLLVLFGRI